MPKIQYKEINFRGKSLDLIKLVNQAVCDREDREKEELQMLVDGYDEAVAYLKGWT